MAAQPVDLALPLGGLNTGAGYESQPPGTTRGLLNVRPRDQRAGGVRRLAQRAGMGKFIAGLTNTGGDPVQAIVAASVVENIGASTLGSTLFTDNCTRSNTASNSGDLGDAFGSDATPDYVIHVSTPARSSQLCLNCVGTALWASGNSLNITSNHIVDDRAWDGTLTDRISYGYFRPSAGTIPTDNFAIKVTFRTANAFSTGSSIGLFCNGDSGTVGEGAFCVGISSGGGQALITNHFKKATSLGATYASVCNTYDDMMILSTAAPGGGASGATPYPTFVLQGDYLTGLGGGTTVGLNLTVNTTYTIEMRKSGNRVELLIDGDTVAIWPDISISGNGLPAAATPVDTSKTHFGFYTNNVGPDSHCDIAYISEILVSSLTVAQPMTTTRIVAVASGDVVSDSDPTWTVASSGSAVVNDDTAVVLVAGLGPTASSNQSYVYMLDGAAYRKILIGAATSALSTWAAGSGLGTLPAGSPDSSQKARYGLVWRNRMVLYGIVSNPDNWYMSRSGDVNDWDYLAIPDGQEAVAGDTTNAGLLAKPISCLAAFDDSNLIMASADQLWVLRDDPAAGGVIDGVSDRFGIVGPFASCRDQKGNFYFVDRSGLAMIAKGASDPVLLSNQIVDDFFDAIDWENSTIRLFYSKRFQGLRLFVCPTTTPSAASDPIRSMWWNQGETPWIDEMPALYHPSAICGFESEQESLMLMGGSDGYVRVFDPDADDDDGEIIESYADLPPIGIDGVAEASLGTMLVKLGENTKAMTVKIRAAENAEAMSTVDFRHTVTLKGQASFGARRLPQRVDRKMVGAAVGVRLGSVERGGYWSVEKVQAIMARGFQTVGGS